MEIFRIAQEEFSSSLFSSRRQARWNFDEEYVIYAASTRSLATLEHAVRKNTISPDKIYKVMIISFDDDPALINTITRNQLSKGWKDVYNYHITQQIGSDWYQKKSSLLLKIPSAIIDLEYNFIINTKHSDFEQLVSLSRIEPYDFDPRLLK